MKEIPQRTTRSLTYVKMFFPRGVVDSRFDERLSSNWQRKYKKKIEMTVKSARNSFLMIRITHLMKFGRVPGNDRALALFLCAAHLVV